MGIESSRQEIVDIETETENRTKKFYQAPEFLEQPCNKQETGRGTLDLTTGAYQSCIRDAFEELAKHRARPTDVVEDGRFLAAEWVRPNAQVAPRELRVLEVMAGNGWNSHIIRDISPTKDYRATDLLRHEPNYVSIEIMPSEEAVDKYGEDSDLLIMVSPPPNCYADYYAIRPFEDISNKYLLFVGELGAADGGSGMYQYLLGSDTKWTLMYREEADKYKDVYGGDCIKEVFLFRNDLVHAK
jgi:hypothetical protein